METNLSRIWLILSLLLSGAAAADEKSDAQRMQELFFPEPQWSYEATPVEYTINGVLFRIPRNLVAEVIRDENGVSTIVLEVLLPNLEGLNARNASCLQRTFQRCTDAIRVGITASPFISDRQLFTQMLARSVEPTKQAGPHGLDQYRPLNADRRRIYRDNFVHEYSGEVILMLDCDKGDPPLILFCSTLRRMPNGKTSFWYRYHHTHLVHWDQIHPAVIDLVNSLVVKNDG